MPFVEEERFAPTPRTIPTMLAIMADDAAEAIRVANQGNDATPHFTASDWGPATQQEVVELMDRLDVEHSVKNVVVSTTSEIANEALVFDTALDWGAATQQAVDVAYAEHLGEVEVDSTDSEIVDSTDFEITHGASLFQCPRYVEWGYTAGS